MCCLPNRFPLPIFLLINKCDQLDRSERRPWMEKFQLENYINENQFYRHYYVSAKKDMKQEFRETLQTTISTSSVDIEHPLKEMVKTVFSFKDLREKFMGKNRDNIKASSRNVSLRSMTNNPKKDRCCIL
jgi:hypothetical protein